MSVLTLDQGWSTHTCTCTRTYLSTFFSVLSCTLYLVKFMSTCTLTYLSTVTKNSVLMSTLQALLSTFLNFNQIGKKVNCFSGCLIFFQMKKVASSIFSDGQIKIFAFLCLKLTKQGAPLCFD